MKDSTLITVASGAATVAAPLIGPPLLTWAVLTGALIGTVVALLFHLKEQKSFNTAGLIETVLIFITGMSAAIFGTSTVAYLLASKFGVEGDGVGLIALVLGFQGKQLFTAAAQVREFLVSKFSKGEEK